jgi:hypothetical protein
MWYGGQAHNTMNLYTKEDVLVLNSMVDSSILQEVRFAIIAWRDDKNDTLRVCNPKDINEKNLEYILKKFIRMLHSQGDFDDFTKFVFEEPLERVPLYINKTNNLKVFARWRLQIGK